MTRTRQEMFDIAVKGLAGQGWRRSVSVEDDCSCKYRGPDGLKCAIGHMISDELYSAELEGRTASDVLVGRAARIAQEDRLYAKEMQKCHDLANNPTDMRKRMRVFAVDHNLTIPDELKEAA